MKSVNYLAITVIAAMLMLTACGNNENDSERLLTDAQKKAEKEAVIETIETYNSAANERNWAKMITTLSDEVTFYGSDSGEVSKTFDEFKATIQNQWNTYELLQYGDVRDAYIELDDYGNYANVIFNSSLISAEKGQKPDTLFALYQRTLKRDPISKKWEITGGILSIARMPEKKAVTEKK